jgi:hypothetical protein
MRTICSALCFAAAVLKSRTKYNERGPLLQTGHPLTGFAHLTLRAVYGASLMLRGTRLRMFLLAVMPPMFVLVTSIPSSPLAVPALVFLTAQLLHQLVGLEPEPSVDPIN